MYGEPTIAFNSAQIFESSKYGEKYSTFGWSTVLPFYHISISQLATSQCPSGKHHFRKRKIDENESRFKCSNKYSTWVPSILLIDIWANTDSNVLDNIDV